MRTSRLGDTVSQVAEAQERLVGRFCSNCRMHRRVEGGRVLGGTRTRSRWVCQACAQKWDRAQEARSCS